MKKYLAVIVLLVFALLLAWAVGFGWRTKSPNQRNGSSDKATDRQQPEATRELVAAERGPLVESPLLGTEDGEQLYERLRQGHIVEDRDDGICTILYPPQEEKPIQRDIAMVELRFMQEKKNGNLEPVTVRHVWVQRRVDGQTKSIDELLEFGGPAPMVKGHTLRVRAAPLGEGIRILAFGRRYLINCKTVDPDTGEDDFYASIIEIPESISPGKMAVFRVILKYPPVKFVKEENEPLKGRITAPLPSTDTKWMVTYSHADDSQRGLTEIDADGTFEFGDSEVGGMLRVIEKGSAGVAWMCVRSVQKRKLSLPRDADMHVPPDKLKEVKLAIPESRVSDAFVGVWLKIEKDDTGPIAWKAFRSSNPAFEKFQSSGIIPMQAPPGSYWVNAFYDPGEADKREWKTLGRIEVPKEPSEHVIEVKPAR